MVQDTNLRIFRACGLGFYGRHVTKKPQHQIQRMLRATCPEASLITNLSVLVQKRPWTYPHFLLRSTISVRPFFHLSNQQLPRVIHSNLYPEARFSFSLALNPYLKS